MILALYLSWCGIWWRLRGGALSTLTGINFGDFPVRVLASLALPLPLMWEFIPYGVGKIPTWYVMLAAPGFLVALMSLGWEEFQDMGKGGDLETEKPNFWPRWLPDHLGLKGGTILYDILGMAQIGAAMGCFPAIFLSYFYHWRVFYLPMMGAGLFLPYLFTRFVTLPSIPRFVQGVAWAEIGAGAIMGLGVYVVMS